MTGVFNDTVDFGGGFLRSAGDTGDVFVVKFDANGNHLWSKGFGDAEPEIGYAIATDGSDNIVVTGVFRGSVDFGGGPLTSTSKYDMFVVKFDASGNHVWSRRFSADDTEHGWGLTVDRSDNIFLTGDFYGTIDFGGGPLTSAAKDMFLVSLDANGNHRWSRAFGSHQRDSAYDVAVDDSGNVFLTGRFTLTVDFGGGTLTSVGDDDIFIAKFSEPRRQ